MIKLGLTGSIGMGKSTVAAMFANAGIPVFDADATVHHLQGPEGELVGAIEAAFPGSTGPRGVDRAALGSRVLGDGAAMKRLEAIVHPAVGAARAYFLAKYAGAELLVFDIPLLFETGGEAAVDKIAVVSAPEAVQRARVLARPGMDAERFESIMRRQWPNAAKTARADFVIPTGGSIAATQAAVDAVIACLTAR